MEDRFNDVLGSARGREVQRREVFPTGPLQVLRDIVERLNEPGRMPPEAHYGARLEAFLVKHGFVVTEWLRTQRGEADTAADQWQHCGFILGIAMSETARPFAFIRLREGPEQQPTDYAQLLLPHD